MGTEVREIFLLSVAKITAVVSLAVLASDARTARCCGALIETELCDVAFSLVPKLAAGMPLALLASDARAVRSCRVRIVTELFKDP